MKKESKRILILVGILIFCAILIALSYFEQKEEQEIILSDFESVLSSEDYELIYIGRPTCSYCTYMQPIVEGLAEEFDFEYTYINSDEISYDNLVNILEQLGNDISEFGTPFSAVIKDGEVVDTYEGYGFETYYFEFLVSSGFLDSELELTLNYLTVDEFVSQTDLDGIYVLASAVNNDVTTMLNEIKTISTDNEIIFNVIYVETEEELATITDTFEYYTDEVSPLFPSTIIIEESQIVSLNYYTSSTDYISFLTSYGFLGE